MSNQRELEAAAEERQRLMQRPLVGRMLKLFADLYSDQYSLIAFTDFLAGSGMEQDEAFLKDPNRLMESKYFFPIWVCIVWSPGGSPQIAAGRNQVETRTLVRMLLEIDQDLSSDDRELLNCMEKITFSWFQVEAVDRGHSMELRDILRNKSMRFLEIAGSQGLKVGSLIFTGWLQFGEYNFTCGDSTLEFPEDYAENAEELREDLLLNAKADADLPRDFRREILKSYWLFRSDYGGRLIGEE